MSIDLDTEVPGSSLRALRQGDNGMAETAGGLIPTAKIIKVFEGLK